MGIDFEELLEAHRQIQKAIESESNSIAFSRNVSIEMIMNRYILLDIDGVMVPINSWKAPAMANDGFPQFSEASVSALNKILAETGASLLLTTSHKDKMDIFKWYDIFNRRGVNPVSISIMPTGKNRFEEILNWEVSDDFIIIDDDTSLNDLPIELKTRLITTSPMIGLTNEHTDNAIKILNNE